MFLTRCLDSHKPCVSVKFKRNVFQSFSKDIVHLLTCYCCKIFAGYTLQYLQLFWIFSQLAEFLVAFSSHLTLIKYYNISWFTWLLGWVYAVENSDYTESSIFPAVFFFIWLEQVQTWCVKLDSPNSALFWIWLQLTLQRTKPHTVHVHSHLLLELQ